MVVQKSGGQILVAAAPVEQDEDGSSEREQWGKWQGETPPEHGSNWQQDQRKSNAAGVTTPEPAAHQTLQRADKQETGEQRDRRRDPMGFERAAAVCREPEHQRHTAPGRDAPDPEEAGQPKAQGV